MDMSGKAELRIIDSDVPSIEPETLVEGRVITYNIVIDREMVGASGG